MPAYGDPPRPDEVPHAAADPTACAQWLLDHVRERLTEVELAFLGELANGSEVTPRRGDWLDSIADGIACELRCVAANRMPGRTA